MARALLRPLGYAAVGVLAVPLVVLYRAHVLGFISVANGLSIVPGAFGRALRRGWYERTLAACGKNLYVDFGAAIRTPKARIGNDCYFGLWSWVGIVDIGDDFMCANNCVILSGRQQHLFDRTDIPMRLQYGEHERVTIGEDVWVGPNVTISADVAPHSILASGAVVTKTFEPYDILGGVPAKAIGNRLAGERSS